MDSRLQSECDLLVNNRRELKKKMFWETDASDVSTMAGFIMTAEGKTADLDKYTACKKILKKKASIFSEFRGIGEAMVITKMTLQDKPDEYLDGAMAVYKKLRSIHKLTASPFMVMAALTIYENGGLEKADENIEKLETLYKAEKKKHPLLVTDEDRGYLAMLNAFALNTDELSEEIERCYTAIKKISINKDAVHSAAQVLSLSNRPLEEKTEMVKAIIDGLKAAKAPISKEYGLPAVSALTLTNEPVDALVADIVDVDKYLKTQRGFKWFNMGGRTRRMYASLVVFMSRASAEDAALASNISATLAMVLVEQLIMLMICMTATANAAANSSNSSSN